MDLSPKLKEKARKAASHQGLSLEQFVFQAVTEKIDSIESQVDLFIATATDGRTASSELREQDGVLVFDTELLDWVDLDFLLEKSRGRSWEELGL